MLYLTLLMNTLPTTTTTTTIYIYLYTHQLTNLPLPPFLVLTRPSLRPSLPPPDIRDTHTPTHEHYLHHILF